MTKEKGKGGVSLSLLLRLGAFLLGALGGFGLAWHLAGIQRLLPADWMEGYARGFAQVDSLGVSFWEVLWNALRWPLFLWLLGFTAFGAWMIPVMFALRGFFLGFSVAGLAWSSDGGLLLAILLFGAGALVSLPVFFVVGADSWRRATAIRGRLWASPVERDRKYWLKSGLLLGITAGCAGIEYWALPLFLRGLAPWLGGT